MGRERELRVGIGKGEGAEQVYLQIKKYKIVNYKFLKIAEL